jgi:hypothetical protein
MSSIIKQFELSAEKVVQRQIHNELIGVSPALIRALANSRQSPSIVQETVVALSKTSQNVSKSLRNLALPPSSTASRKLGHGVPTGLFRLPLEIREQIYCYITGHNIVVKISKNYQQGLLDGTKIPVRWPNNGPKSLLQTCRQM